MNGQTEIANAVLETIEKGAITDLRAFLNARRGVTKWMVTCDYCIGDTGRTRDAIAFTVIPYDAEFPELRGEAAQGLPRDLKKVRALSPEGIAYLCDSRRFHFVVILDRARRVFVDHSGGGRNALVVAREAVEFLVNHLVDRGRQAESVKCARAFQQKSLANGFNVKLFGDQLIVSAVLGLISALLIREAGAKLIGWFSDRDAIVDFGEGIFWEVLNEAAYGISESLGADASIVQWLRAGPDPTPDADLMWFDDFLRSPDHLAGALSAWDIDNNLVPGSHDKYVQLIRDVVADAKNIVVLQLSLDTNHVSASRIVVARNSGETGIAA